MTAKVKKGKRKSASEKRSKSKKALKPSTIVLAAFGAVALGGGAYLAYDHFRNKKRLALNPGSDNKETIIINNNLPAQGASSGNALRTSNAGANDSFPLKQGSRGPRVTQLQQALDSLLGAGSMKRSYAGIDGIFGPGTASALRAAGFEVIVTEEIFNAITKGFTSSTTLINPSEIALLLYRASQSKILVNVISLLRQITSVGQYAQVNESYKKIGLYTKTIVTDLMEIAFKYDDSAKNQLKEEFKRIGLKVDEKTGIWSLQGLNLYRDLITIRDTVVTDSGNHKIPVKKNTIVGDEVKVENGMTWFRAVDSAILQVPTQDVKYTN